METHQIPLMQISNYSERPVDLCVAYVLLWFAELDGRSVFEHKNLSKHVSALSLTQQAVEELSVLVRLNDIANLVHAFELLKSQFKGDESEFLLHMLIDVVSENEVLTAEANHKLRFYADLMGFDLHEIEEQLHSRRQWKLTTPEDLSSPHWWAATDYQEKEMKGELVLLTREQSLYILDLDETASVDDIKRAYRRKVQSYHPDRFEVDGQEAAELAQSKFLLIQKAYEALRL